MRYTFVIIALAGLSTGAVFAGDKEPTFRFFFMDGTVVTGQLAATHVAVRAPDGTVRKLRATNVKNLTPGFASRGELIARARRLIAQLSAKSWHDRKAAHAALARMGPAIAVLLEGYRNDGDLERRTRIEDLLKSSRSPQTPQPHTPAPPRCPIRQADRVTLHDSGEVIDRPLVTRRIDVASVYGRFSVALADLNAMRRAEAGPAEPKYDKPDRITIILAGGKRVKGSTTARALTLRTTQGKLVLPTGQISRLAFGPGRKRVGVVFRNGDHLLGQVIAPASIAIEAPDGKTAAVPLASIAAMSVTPGFVPAGLICWNRLDGSASIVGPGVTFTDIDAFVAGKVARGVQVSPAKGEAIRVPSAILKGAPRGTIEFWTKIVSKSGKKPPPANKRISMISYYEMLHGPVSLMCRSYSTRIPPQVYLRCGGQMVRTDARKKGQDAKDLLTPGRWNHVAVVWDVKGIKKLGGAPVAMLVNGKPFGAYVKNPVAGVPMGDHPFPAYLVLHNSRSTLSPTVIYDELKIWNRVVTDFKQ